MRRGKSHQQTVSEKRREMFRSELAVAWRQAELQGITDTEDERWLEARTEILIDTLEIAILLERDHVEVRTDFAAICEELQL